MEKNKYIKFEGELSRKNKKIFIIKIKTILFLCFFIPCFLALIPCVILTFLDDLIYLLPVSLLLIFPFIFFAIKNKYYEDMLPNKIILYNSMVVCSRKNFETKRDYVNILKIIDYGDCYKMLFKFPHKNQSFICQKDLIKEGSISDFEEIFKDKIIKKA